MPYCAIFTCKNDSRTKNVSCGGVSYHRFPEDPHTKEKWINSTGRRNWMPCKSSTICSEHFDEKHIQISKKGYRYLDDDAIPIHNFLSFQDQNDSENSQPESSRKLLQKSPPLLSSISVAPAKKARKVEESELINSPKYSTPREKKLGQMLQYAESRIRKQNLKIKLLQTQNRRLKTKVKNMEEHLKSLNSP